MAGRSPIPARAPTPGARRSTRPPTRSTPRSSSISRRWRRLARCVMVRRRDAADQLADLRRLVAVDRRALRQAVRGHRLQVRRVWRELQPAAARQRLPGWRGRKPCAGCDGRRGDRHAGDRELPSHAHPITDVATTIRSIRARHARRSGHTHGVNGGARTHIAMAGRSARSGRRVLGASAWRGAQYPASGDRHAAPHGYDRSSRRYRPSGRQRQHLRFNAVDGTRLSTTPTLAAAARRSTIVPPFVAVNFIIASSTMSTHFQPIEIPPGVVVHGHQEPAFVELDRDQFHALERGPAHADGRAGAVHQRRRRRGEVSFARRCKNIHGWYGLDGVYHIAYLCEAHLYIDTGGALTDISPPAARRAERAGGRLRRRRSTSPTLWHAALDPRLGRHHQGPRRLQPR